MAQDAFAAQAEIAKLRFQLARYRRAEFGRASEKLAREEVVHAAPCACPSCGGPLRRIADEVTETLDYVPGRFKVVRHVRAKQSCRACDKVVVSPAPDHAIARGRAGASLLPHIVVSKYDDHLPLYRQAEIFARDGVNLETSTLSGWVGATEAALAPLIDALATNVMASDTLHVDDTPVPVLAEGRKYPVRSIMLPDDRHDAVRQEWNLP